MTTSSEVSRPVVFDQSANKSGHPQMTQSDVRTAAAKEITVALATASIGLLAAFGGVVTFLDRTELAVGLFGARVIFGIPVAQVDNLKVLAVAVGSVGAVAWGLFTAAMAVVVAGIAYFKSR
jgi:hypothetical protein